MLDRVGTLGWIIVGVLSACGGSDPAADESTSGGVTEPAESSGTAPSTTGDEPSTSGEPTSSESSSGAPAESSSSGEPAAESSSSSGEPAAESSSSSETGTPLTCSGETALPDLIGAWASVDPLFPGSPDTLSVLGDGNVTAIFGYDDGGEQAQAQLGGYFVIDGDVQSVALDCGLDCDLAFETSCCLEDDLLRCAPAADWYHLDEIVYARVK